MADNIMLGGNELVVEGWGEYEVHRRKMCYNLSDNEYIKYYSSVKYIYPQHVITSIMKEMENTPIIDVIQRFADTLREKEAENMVIDDSIWIIPKLTSTILLDFIENNLYDVDEMIKINRLLHDYVKTMNLDITLDNLVPIEIVEKPVLNCEENITSIMSLEEKLIPIPTT